MKLTSLAHSIGLHSSVYTQEQNNTQNAPPFLSSTDFQPNGLQDNSDDHPLREEQTQINKPTTGKLSGFSGNVTAYLDTHLNINAGYKTSYSQKRKDNERIPHMIVGKCHMTQSGAICAKGSGSEAQFNSSDFSSSNMGLSVGRKKILYEQALASVGINAKSSPLSTIVTQNTKKIDVQNCSNFSFHHQKRSNSSISSFQKQAEQLPHLVPQKTNVLTGTTTKFYSGQQKQWSDTYQNLLRYQRSIKVEDDFRPGSTLKTNERKVTTAKVEMANVSLPLKGQNIYISDRIREANLRNEVLQQTNQHAKLLTQVKIKLMIDEEERLIKNAENQEINGVGLYLSTDGSNTTIETKRNYQIKLSDQQANFNTKWSLQPRDFTTAPQTAYRYVQQVALKNTLENPIDEHSAFVSAERSAADSVSSKIDPSIKNFTADIPSTNCQKRNNKNDFYRVLLAQNYGGNQLKMNNDVLIPRSILKRNNPGNLVKDKRLQDATEDYIRYQEEQLEQKLNSIGGEKQDEELIGKYDALFGRQISATNPLLSPKMQQILRAQKQEYERPFKRSSVEASPEKELNKDIHSDRSQAQTEMSPCHNKIDNVVNNQEVQSFRDVHKNPIQSDFINSPVGEPDVQEYMQQSRGEQKSYKLRQVRKVEGVFETGLDVVDVDLVIDEDKKDTLHQIQLLFEQGQINKAQMDELVVRQLNQQKIFAFGSYDEFFNEYFKRELVAAEDMNRAFQVAKARKDYAGRRSRSRI